MFSPDSRCLAYVGYRDGRPRVVVDDAEVEGYASSQSPTFSPDSARFAHLATLAGGKSVVVVDGKASAPFDQLLGPARNAPWARTSITDVTPLPRLVFSPDSKRLAYAASRGGTAILVTDGQEQELGRAEVWRLVWSADSRRLAALVVRNDAGGGV